MEIKLKFTQEDVIREYKKKKKNKVIARVNFIPHEGTFFLTRMACDVTGTAGGYVLNRVVDIETPFVNTIHKYNGKDEATNNAMQFIADLVGGKAWRPDHENFYSKLDYEAEKELKENAYRQLNASLETFRVNERSLSDSTDQFYFIYWDIVSDGTTIGYVVPNDLNDLNSQVMQFKKPKTGDGCYVATCVYGSYDCPEVWVLRRFRDYKLANTLGGRLFIKLYYAISPTLVKWFGKTKWFRKMWKHPLDKMVKKYKAEGFKDSPYQDKEY